MTVRVAVHVEQAAAEVAQHCAALPDVAVTVEARIPEACTLLAGTDILITQNSRYQPALAAAVAATPGLAVVQTLSTGIDSFIQFGLPHQVRLAHAGDLWASPVGEHTMALLLALARRIPQIERNRQDHIWDRAGIGGSVVTLTDRNLLVLGLGSIGRAVAQRAAAFGMRVTGMARQKRAPAAADHVVRIAGLDSLHEELAIADAVVVALPLVESTRNLIDAQALAAMRRSALLVNIARGAIVDEAALADALASGRLGGAAIDVAVEEPLPPASPLWSLGGLIISPHVAGYGDAGIYDSLAALCAANVARFRDGLPLLNEVRMPCPAPAGAGA